MEIVHTTGRPPAPVGPVERASQPSPAATELPDRKVVAPVPPSEPTTAAIGTSPTGDSPARTGPDDGTERRLAIDPQTRSLVAETVDTTTHEILGQLPDRSLLGLRAYLDGLARRQDEVAQTRNIERHVLPALVA